MSAIDDTLRPITPVDLRLVKPAERMPTPGVCPDCDGIGWRSSGPVRGAWGDGAATGLVPCHCRQQHQQQQRYTELLTRSHLEHVRHKTFAAFDPTVAGVTAAFNAALRYSTQLTGWLVLTGGYGVGKTHLAAAVGNTAFDAGTPVYFAVIGELLDDLRATFDREQQEVRFEKLFGQIKSIPLLIMDDLGTEKESDWAREKIFQILDWRYTRNLATVITSNKPAHAIDPRVTSRASDMAFEKTIHTIRATDYRLRNLHGGWLAPDTKGARSPQ